MNKIEIWVKNNTYVIFTFIATIAIAIRLLPFNKVFINGQIYPIGFDSYYHMRRIFFTTNHFPDYISFDSYINYPYGSVIGWPPLYDQVASLFALINGFGSPETSIIEFAAASFPLLLGIMSLVALYFAASMIFDRNIALLSVGILAILPVHIDYSMFGFIDHHIAEVLLLTIAYGFFIAALKSSNNIQLSFSILRRNGLQRANIEPLMYATGAGVFLAGALLTWIGAPIFIGIIAVYAVVQFTLDLKNKKSSDYLVVTLIVTYIVSLILMTPVIMQVVRPGLEMGSFLLSWFQVLFLVVMIFWVALLNVVSKLVHLRNIEWWFFPLIVGVIALFGLFSIKTFSPTLFYSLFSGFTYLLGGGDVLGTVSEAQPIFFNSGKFTLLPVIAGFGLTFFIAILAFLLFIKKMIKGNSNPEMIFFMVWTLIILVLTLFQRRFIYQLSINVAILSGFFLMLSLSLSLSLSLRLILNLGMKNPGKHAGKKLKTAFIIILIAVLIIPNVYIGYLKVTNPQIPPSDWIESLEWLKDNSPKTSFYDNPIDTPEYGVMSWWSYGNWIVYLAQRPVVTNNFQVGVEDAANFFIEQDKSKAMSILKSRNIKYVITTDEMIFLKSGNIAQIAGEKPEDYSVNNENLKNTVMWSLHVNDGVKMDSMRLIFESGSENIISGVKSIKIFEYTNGAHIIGQTSPNESVVAFTNVTTNKGRTFLYFNMAVTNETGWYDITVPYPTNGLAHDTRSTELYKVLNSTNIVLKEVSVSELDVQKGGNINV